MLNKIDARNYNINEILWGSKYYIDDYQREYRWEKRQIEELLSDLWEKFNEFHINGNKYLAVKDYGVYFLGSILISSKDSNQYIVDGQQRLTSLTLLIIYLHNTLNNMNLQNETQKISNLVYSDNYGDKSFNIKVDDREMCMNALFNNNFTSYTPDDDNLSSINLYDRYLDICNFFEDSELNKDNIVHFIYWLKENVYLVKITTYSDDEAYTIFETMNDRGLNLDSTEMLKGYLIANLSEDKRSLSNATWKKIIADLKSISKDEDSIFFKNWLRAKYAKTSRVKNQLGNYISEDFEKISNAYHKWIKENKDVVGLKDKNDFFNFIESDLKKYAKLNLKIKKLEMKLDDKFMEIFSNSSQGFTLQTMLIFSAINIEDSNEIVNEKIKMVSKFIDIFIARYIANYKVLGYSGVVYRIFNYVKIIREHSQTVETLRRTLKGILKNLDVSLEGLLDLKLNKQNRYKIHYLLARITDYLETSSGSSTQIDKYLNKRNGSRPFEIEHVIPDNYNNEKNEYTSEEEFQSFRNKIGNLCLLQNGTNQSIGNNNFNEKKIRYKGENVLLQSLCEEAYINNPNFTNFIKEQKLNFKSYELFGRNEIEKRTILYYEVAKKIWNPENI